ncbi:MAG: hypothetical protein SVK54_06620 [candidate division WOR-3 bacterium]|nr:hypothetical protein [candidate division WOR-3 bacterium]
MNIIKLSIFILLTTLLIISGCSLLPFLSTRDINTVSDWIDTPAENTVYTYEFSDYHNDSPEGTPAEIDYEITDLTTSDNIIIIELTDENDYVSYLIVDDSLGILANSANNSYEEDNDWVYLEKPVEEGNSWYPYSGANYQYTIEGTGVSKTVEAGTYNDCVYLTAEYTNDANIKYEYEVYLSPSAGNIIYEKNKHTFSDGESWSEIVELISID